MVWCVAPAGWMRRNPRGSYRGLRDHGVHSAMTMTDKFSLLLRDHTRLQSRLQVLHVAARDVGVGPGIEHGGGADACVGRAGQGELEHGGGLLGRRVPSCGTTSTPSWPTPRPGMYSFVNTNGKMLVETDGVRRCRTPPEAASSSCCPSTRRRRVQPQQPGRRHLDGDAGRRDLPARGDGLLFPADDFEGEPRHAGSDGAVPRTNRVPMLRARSCRAARACTTWPSTPMT